MMVDLPDNATMETDWAIRKADGQIVEYTNASAARRYIESNRRQPGDQVVWRMRVMTPWREM